MKKDFKMFGMNYAVRQKWRGNSVKHKNPNDFGYLRPDKTGERFGNNCRMIEWHSKPDRRS
jgi:hypothetical protein